MSPRCSVVRTWSPRSVPHHNIFETSCLKNISNMAIFEYIMYIRIYMVILWPNIENGPTKWPPRNFEFRGLPPRNFEYMGHDNHHETDKSKTRHIHFGGNVWRTKFWFENLLSPFLIQPINRFVFVLFFLLLEMIFSENALGEIRLVCSTPKTP